MTLHVGPVGIPQSVFDFCIQQNNYVHDGYCQGYRNRTTPPAVQFHLLDLPILYTDV